MNDMLDMWRTKKALYRLIILYYDYHHKNVSAHDS